MADTPNSVIRGYSWSQEFICPDGTLESFDDVVSEIEWYRIGFAHPIGRMTCSTMAGDIITDGQMITITIEEGRTALLLDGERIRFDFKRIRDGAEVYLGVRVNVPIIEPITKGALG